MNGSNDGRIYEGRGFASDRSNDDLAGRNRLGSFKNRSDKMCEFVDNSRMRGMVKQGRLRGFKNGSDKMCGFVDESGTLGAVG